MNQQIRLVRRWGSHQPGETVDVDKPMADWLVDQSYGETTDNPGTATARAKDPGTDGPDPRAGGDPTRHRLTGEVKGARGGNRASRVTGSPSPGGAMLPGSIPSDGDEEPRAGTAEPISPDEPPAAAQLEQAAQQSPSPQDPDDQGGRFLSMGRRK